ncbi:unnamed protein product, partial [Urochloa humidicola]
MMSAKIAYENAAYIENVVKNVWKFNFVGYYNCWNKFVGDHTTQAFVMTDRAADASVVVVSFRGTEPFNTRDWSTDVNLSWLGMGDMGHARPRRLPQGPGPPGGGRQGRRPGLPQVRSQRRRRQAPRLLQAPGSHQGAAQEAPPSWPRRHGPQPRRRARRHLPGAPGAPRRARRARPPPFRGHLRPAPRRRRRVRRLPPRERARGAAPGGVPVRRGAAGAVRRAARGGVRARRDVRVLRRVVQGHGHRQGRGRAQPQLLRPEVPAVHVRQRVGGPVQGGVPVDERGEGLQGGRRVAAVPRRGAARARPRVAQPQGLRQRRPSGQRDGGGLMIMHI